MQENYSKVILERPLRYNITCLRMELVNVNQSTAVDLANLLTGVRPNVVVVQFVASATAAGTYSYQPFASTKVMQYNTSTSCIAPAVVPRLLSGGRAGEMEVACK